MLLFSTSEYKNECPKRIRQEFSCGIGPSITEEDKKNGSQIVLVSLPAKTYSIRVPQWLGKKLIKNVGIGKAGGFSPEVIFSCLESELMDLLRKINPSEPGLVALKAANKYFNRLLEISYYDPEEKAPVAAAAAKTKASAITLKRKNTAPPTAARSTTRLASASAAAASRAPVTAASSAPRLAPAYAATSLASAEKASEPAPAKTHVRKRAFILSKPPVDHSFSTDDSKSESRKLQKLTASPQSSHEFLYNQTATQLSNHSSFVTPPNAPPSIPFSQLYSPQAASPRFNFGLRKMEIDNSPPNNPSLAPTNKPASK